MKIISFILFCFFSLQSASFAQVGYVEVEDEVYSFLDRMNTIGIISNYNSFELPKSRKEIKKFLSVIIENKNKLDEIDYYKLNDFIAEFEIDLFSTLNKSENLFPNLNLNYLLSEKEKYLYSYSDTNGSSIFVNFVGKLDYLGKSNIETSNNSNSLLYRFGGDVSGTLFNKIGFNINTTNGTFTGNKLLAQSFSSLRYNYKFNEETTSELGDSYFDETSAFLAFENDYLRLKIGNDRKIIGHGSESVLLSTNAPRMDYIGLDLKYKSLEFSFFHGKLLGAHSIFNDSIQGSVNKVSDKYLVYHRLGLNLSKHFNFAIGEMIIYSNRNVDFSYLNPFNFYKSAEHANLDRDNTFLFFDFQNNSIDNLKLYSTIIIDDIDFGKLGSGWYGNQTLISLGAYSSQLYKIAPIDFELQYIKIDPYVFTHRIVDNNFTNSLYSLGTTLQPNSSSSIINIYYRPHHRVNIRMGFTYTLHSANEVDSFGHIIKNNGGDILVGHRPNDLENIYFLNDELEIYRKYQFSASIEPVKNWIFDLNLNYTNNSLTKSQQSEELFTIFSVCTKL